MIGSQGKIVTETFLPRLIPVRTYPPTVTDNSDKQHTAKGIMYNLA